MNDSGITQAQREAIVALAPALDGSAYLAGGVAVALAAKHRTSLDVDLFVPHDFDEERLVERVSAEVRGAVVTGQARATLHLEVEGVPVSILSYRYPMLSPPHAESDLPILVADLGDLACMKLSAIAGRGAAKDFWDLDVLLALGVAGGSLAGVLALFRKKFAVHDVGHVVRSLAYFGDADTAPLPRGLSPERWDAVKSAMRRRVKAL